MVQEECSTRSARPTHFRAARADGQERSLSDAAARAQFSRFGTDGQITLHIRKLETYLTQMFSATSKFLIDNFSHVSQVPGRRPSPKFCISDVSHTKQNTKWVSEVFFPICAALRANHPTSNFQFRTSALSNRNTKKLEIALSHRKQSLGKFLIATFRALFCPGAESPFDRNQLTPSYVPNHACGGCNLPCRP